MNWNTIIWSNFLTLLKNKLQIFVTLLIIAITSILITFQKDVDHGEGWIYKVYRYGYIMLSLFVLISIIYVSFIAVLVFGTKVKVNNLLLLEYSNSFSRIQILVMKYIPVIFLIFLEVLLLGLLSIPINIHVHKNLSFSKYLSLSNTLFLIIFIMQFIFLNIFLAFLLVIKYVYAILNILFIGSALIGYAIFVHAYRNEYFYSDEVMNEYKNVNLTDSHLSSTYKIIWVHDRHYIYENPVDLDNALKIVMRQNKNRAPFSAYGLNLVESLNNIGNNSKKPNVYLHAGTSIIDTYPYSYKFNRKKASQLKSSLIINNETYYNLSYPSTDRISYEFKEINISDIPYILITEKFVNYMENFASQKELNDYNLLNFKDRMWIIMEQVLKHYPFTSLPIDNIKFDIYSKSDNPNWNNHFQWIPIYKYIYDLQIKDWWSEGVNIEGMLSLIGTDDLIERTYTKWNWIGFSWMIWSVISLITLCVAIWKYTKIDIGDLR